MRVLTFIISIILLFPISATAVNKDSGKSDFIVVLDPGHGGKDYGAIGATTNEKSINLAVAKLVAASLRKTDGIKVVMTRDDDYFLTLQERANVANRAHGDLFISIHVNSVDYKARNRSTIAGAAVYTLGLHRTAENLEVAKRENAVMVLEPDYTTTYSGFDPNSAESYIVFELNQNKHLDQSIQFAQTVQSELVSTAHRKDNGVRQAGFWVLMATSMPAVLVELDFICNPQSEAYLSSAEGQRQLSKSIVDAVKTYHSGNKSAHATPSTKPTVTEPVAATAPVDKQTPSNKQAPVDNDKRDTKVSETSAPKQADHSVSKTTPTDKAPQGLTYRIQILASDKKVKTTSAEFKGQSDITEYTEKGLYKYTVGDYSSMDEANAALRTVRKKFPQAFVIKWNGARVY